MGKSSLMAQGQAREAVGVPPIVFPQKAKAEVIALPKNEHFDVISKEFLELEAKCYGGKALMAKIQFEEARDLYKRKFIPAFLSNETKSYQKEKEAYSELEQIYLQSAQNIKNILKLPKAAIEGKEIKVLLDENLKVLKEQESEVHQKLNKAWRIQEDNRKNWEFAELTTHYLRDSFIISGCTIVGSLLAPIIFGATIAAAGGMFATAMALGASALVGGVLGYLIGRFAVFLENTLGGQSKNSHDEAKAIATEAAIEGVSGGILGIFMKVFNPLAKPLKELGKKVALELTFKSGVVSGFTKFIIHEQLRFNKEIVMFEQWCAENKIDRLEYDKWRNIFNEQRGFTLNNFALHAGLDATMSGVINIQGVNFHFFREQAKTNLRKGMLLATEHGSLIAQSAMTDLVHHREIKNEQEFFAKIFAFFTNNLIQTIISRRPVKTPQINFGQLKQAFFTKLQNRLQPKIIANKTAATPISQTAQGKDQPTATLNTVSDSTGGKLDSHTTKSHKGPRREKDPQGADSQWSPKSKKTRQNDDGEAKETPKNKDDKTIGKGKLLPPEDQVGSSPNLIEPRGKHAGTFEKIFNSDVKDIKVLDIENLLFYIGASKTIRGHVVTWNLFNKTLRYHKPHKHGTTLDRSAVDRVRDMLIDLGYKIPE